MTREDLLTRFQAKAGCMHTQDEAHRRWVLLAPHLTETQRGHLGTGWGHHTMPSHSEGRGELDSVCASIRKEWADDD